MFTGDPRYKEFCKEFEKLGESGVRIGISTGQFKLTPLKHESAVEWIRLKEVQEKKTNPDPEHWYKKPIGVIGISVSSGVLLYIAIYLVRNHAGIP